MQKNFRLCAGAVVFNEKGQVLLCNRNDTKNDAWQFPQGGIEKNESTQIAAERELFEETSIVSVDCIYTMKKPLRYEFPIAIKQNFNKRGILCDGQDIYFSLFYFKGNESEIDVFTSQPEFKEYQWQDFSFAVDNIVDFKKQVYLSIQKEFEPLIKQYLNNLS